MRCLSCPSLTFRLFCSAFYQQSKKKQKTRAEADRAEPLSQSAVCHTDVLSTRSKPKKGIAGLLVCRRSDEILECDLFFFCWPGGVSVGQSLSLRQQGEKHKWKNVVKMCGKHVFKASRLVAKDVQGDGLFWSSITVEI